MDAPNVETADSQISNDSKIHLRKNRNAKIGTYVNM